MRVTFLFLLLSVVLGNAQDYPRKEVSLERLVDELFPFQEADVNYEDLYENLAQMLLQPLDLNKVTEEQLQSLLLLRPIEIKALLDYRQQNGPFLSVYELQVIPGFSRDLFLKIIPFVTVPEATGKLNQVLFKRMMEPGNHELIMRYERTLETREGFQPSEEDGQKDYVGSPNKYYVRYRSYQPGDFSVGFTAEKDPGERWQWNPSRRVFGIDYTSGHLQWQQKGVIQNLILGDFQVQFGQGIALGSSFGFGKNAESVTTVRRSNLGFLPYTSLYEAGHLRGGAVSLALQRHLTLHAFYSSRGRDGNLNNDSLQVSDVATSFTFTGLHRTTSELENQNAITEKNLGAVLSWKYPSLEAGVISHHTRFNIPLFRERTPYNQFTFSGNENTNVGAYLNYSFQNITFFSEFSHSVHHGSALATGLAASPTSKLDLALHYRRFARNYYSFFSNAFSESGTQNEHGVYWGWKYTFSRKYWISGYVDLFSFPWLRFRVYAPSEGFETLARFNYAPAKGMLIYLQYRQEKKDRNLSNESAQYQTAPATRQNIWFHTEYRISPSLTAKSRVQWSNFSFNHNLTEGLTVLQDLAFSKGKFTLSGRYALFNTDDFENRQYVFEKDVYMAFSFPAYFGVGVRQYLIVQYQITRHLEVWLRWARTEYRDRDQIGSGNELIDGNTRNDVKFQARLRL